MQRSLAYLPGLVGWVLVTYLAVLATIWTTPFILGQQPSDKLPALAFLIPPLVATILAAIPVRWPWMGGWFLGALGLSLLFTAIPWKLACVVVLTAGLFLMEGRRLKLGAGDKKSVSGFLVFLSPQQRVLITLGLPVLVFMGFAALALG